MLAAFLNWRTEATVGKNKQDAALSALCDRQKRNLLVAWRHAVIQQAFLVERVACLLEAAHHRALVHTFGAWRAFAAGSAQSARQAESHQQKRQMQATLSAWRQQAMIGRYERVAIEDRARHHQDLRMLSSSLKGFRACLSHRRKAESLAQRHRQLSKRQIRVFFCLCQTTCRKE